MERMQERERVIRQDTGRSRILIYVLTRPIDLSSKSARPICNTPPYSSSLGSEFPYLDSP